MANIGTITAHIGMDTRRLRADHKRAQGMISNFSNRASKGYGRIAASVAKLGGLMAGLGATVGVAAVFKSITQTGVQFEQTMATVAGVMRATAEESDRLTMAARKMGETTEWSASQAGEALQFLGMAGFDANKAIAALPGTLDLATAGGLDLGRAADIATNALTAMGLNVDELTRVNDVFVGTITRTNTNMEMMAESFKYAAPVARAYGYTIEELSGLIGMLGNAGIQGSMAGTQLAMAIQKTDQVAADFGVSGGDFVDVLEQLRAKGINAKEVITAFGLRAGRAAGVLYEATDATREFQGTLRDVSGEAAELANKMRNTLGGTFKELKSVIESVALDVFETYRDSLRDLVRDTIGWLRENKTKLIEFAETLKGVIVAFAELVAEWASLLGSAERSFNAFYDAVDARAAASASTMEDAGLRAARAWTAPERGGWDAIFAVIEELSEKFDAVWTYFEEMAANAMAGVLNHFLILINNIYPGFAALWESIRALMAGKFGEATQIMGDYNLKVLREMRDNWGAYLDSNQAAWNRMVEGLTLPDWMKKIGAHLGEIEGFQGPTAQPYGPWPEVGAAKRPPGRPPGGGGKVMELTGAPLMAPESLSEVVSEVMAYYDKLRKMEENRLKFQLMTNQISKEDYLEALREQQGGYTAYSDDWMSKAAEIAAMEQSIAADRKAAWVDWTTIWQEGLDAMLTGYETFWASLLQYDMTGKERREAIWASMKNSFVGLVAEMTKTWIKSLLMQVLVTRTTETAKTGAVIAGTAARMAAYIAEGAAAIASAAKSVYSAAAKIYEQHAWIPFAGIGIAAALVATMIANLSGLIKWHAGGLAGDEMLGVLKKKEFVVREPAVAAVGVPALEYINRTGRLPGGTGEGVINVDMSGSSFGTMDPVDRLTLPLDIEDAVVEAINNARRTGRLER